MTTVGDPHTTATLIGARVAGRYEISAPLAPGGMATLWRGWDRRLCRPVAVKTLRDEDLTDDIALARLRREALVSAAIAHPNIVEVYDLVDEAGRPYLVMELVEGRDLKRLLRERGALDPADALKIAQQICLGLSVVHTRKVVHRDIKPHNILLSSLDHVKLTDFGLAQSPLEIEEPDPDVVYGTPEYMAPEQAMGERVTPACDLYSLGVTLYEALIGAPPFLGDSAEETMRQQVTEPAVPLRRVRPEIPASVERVIMRALDKEPERRYASAERMGEALRQAAAEMQRPRAVFPVHGARNDIPTFPTDAGVDVAAAALVMPAAGDDIALAGGGIEPGFEAGPIAHLVGMLTELASPRAAWMALGALALLMVFAFCLVAMRLPL